LQASFRLSWGCNGEKNGQHKHDVVSFEKGDITTASRSNKQVHKLPSISSINVIMFEYRASYSFHQTTCFIMAMMADFAKMGNQAPDCDYRHKTKLKGSAGYLAWNCQVCQVISTHIQSSILIAKLTFLTVVKDNISVTSYLFGAQMVERASENRYTCGATLEE
jgi:hypothetical protein